MRPTTAAGDPTRPNFMLNQMTNASLTYSPTTGIGSPQAPFSGTLTDYMSQIASQQSQAANAATNLQQGQDTVVSALQQRFNDQSGVNIDTEMSNLIALQNAYARQCAGDVDDSTDDDDAVASGAIMSITGPGSITAANLLAQTNMHNQLDTLSRELGSGQAAQTIRGLGSQAGLAMELDAQLSAINGYSNTATTVGTTLEHRSVGPYPARQCRECGPASGQSAGRVSLSTIPARRRRRNPPRASSTKFFPCSTPRSATIICFRAAR